MASLQQELGVGVWLIWLCSEYKSKCYFCGSCFTVILYRRSMDLKFTQSTAQIEWRKLFVTICFSNYMKLLLKSHNVLYVFLWLKVYLFTTLVCIAGQFVPQQRLSRVSFCEWNWRLEAGCHGMRLPFQWCNQWVLETVQVISLKTRHFSNRTGDFSTCNFKTIVVGNWPMNW